MKPGQRTRDPVHGARRDAASSRQEILIHLRNRRRAWTSRWLFRENFAWFVKYGIPVRWDHGHDERIWRISNPGIRESIMKLQGPVVAARGKVGGEFPAGEGETSLAAGAGE
jgi:hypothetical protein